jgi:hypothetical protein
LGTAGEGFSIVARHYRDAYRRREQATRLLAALATEASLAALRGHLANLRQLDQQPGFVPRAAARELGAVLHVPCAATAAAHSAATNGPHTHQCAMADDGGRWRTKADDGGLRTGSVAAVRGACAVLRTCGGRRRAPRRSARREEGRAAPGHSGSWTRKPSGSTANPTKQRTNEPRKQPRRNGRFGATCRPHAAAQCVDRRRRLQCRAVRTGDHVGKWEESALRHPPHRVALACERIRHRSAARAYTRTRAHVRTGPHALALRAHTLTHLKRCGLTGPHGAGGEDNPWHLLAQRSTNLHVLARACAGMRAWVHTCVSASARCRGMGGKTTYGAS